MRLFLAEKKSLGEAIAAGLGNGRPGSGRIDCGEDVVTWCAGHLLEELMPEDYDEKWGIWRMEDLPIMPDVWKSKPKASAGKQLGIGTGDINIAVQFHAKRIDTFFPGFYFLNLIKKEVYLPFDSSCAADDLIMECHGVTETGVAHILKVDGDKLAAVHTGSVQLFFDQVQHNRLPASADAGQDLYQVVSDERTDPAHIGFPFDHLLPPF